MVSHRTVTPAPERVFAGSSPAATAHDTFQDSQAVRRQTVNLETLGSNPSPGAGGEGGHSFPRRAHNPFVTPGATQVAATNWCISFYGVYLVGATERWEGDGRPATGSLTTALLFSAKYLPYLWVDYRA